MSQQQAFSGGNSPVTPDIEFIQGNTGGPVGPNPATFTIDLLGDTAQGVSVDGDPGTYTQTITVQDATAAATSGAALKGVCSFDSNDFTVTNGFVELIGNYDGTGTTIGATTADIITVPLGGSAGTFQFEARVKAFEATNPAGAGYNIYATFTTDGVTATLVGDQPIFNEDGALAAADAYFVASGNNAILQVLGVALLTIDWTGSLELT